MLSARVSNGFGVVELYPDQEQNVTEIVAHSSSHIFLDPGNAVNGRVTEVGLRENNFLAINFGVWDNDTFAWSHSAFQL